MTKKKTIITIASAMLMTTALNSAVFNNYAKAQDININSNNADGKLMLKADIGYVYSFAGDWNKSNAKSPSIGGNTSVATGGVGYGASLGYTHKSGLGLSADYLGFNHKWTGLGTDVKSKTEFNYDASYHVVTLVPSYRIKLDTENNWGLRVGLGIGFSLSDVSWAQKISASNGASNGTKVAGGASYTTTDFNTLSASGTTGCGDGSGNWGYGDSLGGIFDAVDDLNPVNGVNQCSGFTANASGGRSPVIHDGLSDAVLAAQIAKFYRAGGNGASIVGKMSYGVWRIISSDPTKVAGILGGSTVDANATFETRDQYITRCNTATDHCAGFNTLAGGTKPTYANGNAAAAAVDASAAAAKLAADKAKCDTMPGYTFANGTCNAPAAASSGGKAKDDAGFVLAPQVALEYDNGMLHADVNVKYIHELFNVRYFGSEGSVSGQKESGAITYMSKAGPLAIFIGAGMGVNF